MSPSPFASAQLGRALLLVLTKLLDRREREAAKWLQAAFDGGRPFAKLHLAHLTFDAGQEDAALDDEAVSRLIVLAKGHLPHDPDGKLLRMGKTTTCKIVTAMALENSSPLKKELFMQAMCIRLQEKQGWLAVRTDKFPAGDLEGAAKASLAIACYYCQLEELEKGRKWLEKGRKWMLTCRGCRVARFCSADHQKMASKKAASCGSLTTGRHKDICGVLRKWRDVVQDDVSRDSCTAERFCSERMRDAPRTQRERQRQFSHNGGPGRRPAERGRESDLE